MTKEEINLAIHYVNGQINATERVLTLYKLPREDEKAIKLELMGLYDNQAYYNELLALEDLRLSYPETTK